MKNIIKKSTSKNMTTLIELILKDIKKKPKYPIVKKNNIKWSGYNITFLEDDIWKFTKPDDDYENVGKFPSGVGHVSNSIRINIDTK